VFLTLALDGGKWSASRPGRFNFRKNPTRTYWIESSVHPRAGLDAVPKRRDPCPCRESKSGRPACSSVNTDWAAAVTYTV